MFMDEFSFDGNLLIDIDIDCSWKTIRNILVDQLNTFYYQTVSTMLKHHRKQSARTFKIKFYFLTNFI